MGHIVSITTDMWIGGGNAGGETVLRNVRHAQHERLGQLLPGMWRTSERDRGGLRCLRSTRPALARADAARSYVLQSDRSRHRHLRVVMASAVIDRIWLHVYSPDVGALKARIGAQQQELEQLQKDESLDVLDLQAKLNTLQSRQQMNVTPPLDTEGFWRDERISKAVTVLSLLSAYGGYQSTTSAAGRACHDYLMFGTGSVTDCGFQHADSD
jgi:hypothetical protein